ncbi:MAG TPA: D-2-hydroxyacid dehydrogenase [Longimicrobiaceae bacterium]|nr:D-2-hydroxyacid dehydrogenase [Longimicrobiaceae bacterium]
MPRIVIDLKDERPIWAVPDWTIDAIREALPADWEIEVVDAPVDGKADGGGGSEASISAIRGAEIYVGFGISPPLFAAATAPPAALRWVHSAAAGVGSSLFPAMRDSDIVLTNSAGVHAPPMAEWAIAVILYFARGLDFALRAQARSRWDKAPFEDESTPVREISGATLGIVGLGGIGREIATRASALGMRVIGTRRTPGEPPPGVDRVSGPESLPDLLEESDFIVIAVPDTAATRGVIGAAELARMRPDAVLVNLARGPVVDETALIDALSSGRLRGAALDVFNEEPLPASSPLWKLPNVLITPHVSPTSRGYWKRETDLIVENLRRYLAGEEMLNVVDKVGGY